MDGNRLHGPVWSDSSQKCRSRGHFKGKTGLAWGIVVSFITLVVFSAPAPQDKIHITALQH
jgi:hypothetical protein